MKNTSSRRRQDTTRGLSTPRFKLSAVGKGILHCLEIFRISLNYHIESGNATSLEGSLAQWSAAKWASHGQFSTSSLYKLLMFRGIRHPSVSYIWHTNCPESISILRWFIIRRRLLTKNRLIARNLAINPQCPFCDVIDESDEHFFSTCRYIKQGWTVMLEWCKLPSSMQFRPSILSSPGNSRLRRRNFWPS
ncbi:hypothetical protein Cni_G11448 [Canna indica]|uniref:Reverse transcriptase zinc-binding domain-containing protein n=1 Tax=Canna indica TaxID=4628 RepID=A0AAQ3Q9J7_9LILI|nr:hypothetical protein Cni_G11448 [Canna indica]